jgi:hypothetical protein
VTDNAYVRNVVHCAGPNCDAVRKDVNHWFLVGFVDGTFCCRAFDGVVMFPEDLPVCGQQCAQRLFEQWLNRR